MKEKILNKIYNMRALIIECPELFSDGIDEEIIDLLNEIKKYLESEKR